MNRASRDSLSEAEVHVLREADRIERGIKRTASKLRKANKKARNKAQNLEAARAALDGVTAKFRQPRERDNAFMAWLRDLGLCIACEIEGEPDTRGEPNPIEAAHQKLNIAAAGWSKVSGARVHDRQCVPLCRWHHQLAPNACDKGQRQFWARLGIGDGVAYLCEDLYRAFKGGNSGASIIRCYAEDDDRGFSPSRTRKHAEDVNP